MGVTEISFLSVSATSGSGPPGLVRRLNAAPKNNSAELASELSTEPAADIEEPAARSGVGEGGREDAAPKNDNKHDKRLSEHAYSTPSTSSKESKLSVRSEENGYEQS
ncbi:hypothetical protein Bbelb_373120 [Branchiostoma belcheri]|nr:hypothetical protein Bbelb_373120 [Branchiostoma belcheri]